MLVVTVELWPGGDITRAKKIAFATVSNISELADESDYFVTASEEASALTGPARDTMAEVKGHLRKQPVWALVAKVAQAIMDAKPPFRMER